MARPKSDDKRSAIVAAAIRVVAAQGAAAPTALIAKEAKISTGALFTYFATKAELYNTLYRELKDEMARAALSGVRSEQPSKRQLEAMFATWLQWATEFPEKRRVIALLGVADELTDESRTAGHRTMAPVAALLNRLRENGPLKDAPLSFVTSMLNAIAETTIDEIARDPKRAELRTREAFEAFLRVVS